MKRKMTKEEFKKMGITAIKRVNYWEILLDGRQAMVGLSDKDLELLRQKSAREVMKILTYV